MALAIVRRPLSGFAKIAAKALAPALLAALPGCRHFEQTKECRALADAVNSTLSRVDEARKKGPENAASYRQIAKDYDALSAVIVQLPIKSKRLLEAAADYQRLTTEAARDARQFADALDSKDMTRQLSARSAATRTLKHEASALARIDATCRVR